MVPAQQSLPIKDKAPAPQTASKLIRHLSMAATKEVTCIWKIWQAVSSTPH